MNHMTAVGAATVWTFANRAVQQAETEPLSPASLPTAKAIAKEAQFIAYGAGDPWDPYVDARVAEVWGVVELL